jgi:hypothetical protein
MGRRLGVSALLVVAWCSMAVSQTFPSDDPEFIPRERRAMPMEKPAGKLQEWPPVREPKREGGVNTQ